MKDRRVLVTGGSGFIGSHLTKKLVQMGAEVYVLSMRKTIVSNIRLKDVWEKIHVLDADIRNLDSLKILKDVEPEIVFHLAAYIQVGYSFTHYSEAIGTDCLGTANLVESLDNYDRFVYTCSAEVYGAQDSVPFREDMTPRPISPYAIGKYGGELYLMMKHHMGHPITVLRLFNNYGPFQSSEAIIPEVILDCLQGKAVRATKGKQTRDFNYVEDTVEALILAAQTNAAVGEIINIGTGRETSIRDLILKIVELTNSESKVLFGALPYRPTVLWRIRADNTKAKRILNWAPKVPLEVGLKRTIDWFRENMKQFF